MLLIQNLNFIWMFATNIQPLIKKIFICKIEKRNISLMKNFVKHNANFRKKLILKPEMFYVNAQLKKIQANLIVYHLKRLKKVKNLIKNLLILIIKLLAVLM